jgi:hypothetical protein
MNEKYTKKPNPNPNEPNLFGFANVIPATCPYRRGNAGIQVLLLEAGSWPLEAVSQKRTQSTGNAGRPELVEGSLPKTKPFGMA